MSEKTKQRPCTILVITKLTRLLRSEVGRELRRKITIGRQLDARLLGMGLLVPWCGVVGTCFQKMVVQFLGTQKHPGKMYISEHKLPERFSTARGPMGLD